MVGIVTNIEHLEVTDSRGNKTNSRVEEKTKNCLLLPSTGTTATVYPSTFKT